MSVLRTFYLQIVEENPGTLPDERPEELPEVMSRALSEAEENISDLLPEGYYAKIGEWDSE